MKTVIAALTLSLFLLLLGGSASASTQLPPTKLCSDVFYHDAKLGKLLLSDSETAPGQAIRMVYAKGCLDRGAIAPLDPSSDECKVSVDRFDKYLLEVKSRVTARQKAFHKRYGRQLKQTKRKLRKAKGRLDSLYKKVHSGKMKRAKLRKLKRKLNRSNRVYTRLAKKSQKLNVQHVTQSISTRDAAGVFTGMLDAYAYGCTDSHTYNTPFDKLLYTHGNVFEIAVHSWMLRTGTNPFG